MVVLGSTVVFGYSAVVGSLVLVGFSVVDGTLCVKVVFGSPSSIVVGSLILVGFSVVDGSSAVLSDSAVVCCSEAVGVEAWEGLRKKW